MNENTLKTNGTELKHDLKSAIGKPSMTVGGILDFYWESVEKLEMNATKAASSHASPHKNSTKRH